jgi:co-chaperonin GroES (HSP10)
MSHTTHELDDGTVLRVMGDGILVQPDEPPTESKGGIQYPDGHMEHPLNTGTVLAYGYMRDKKGRHRPYPIPDLKVGDKVGFIRFLAKQNTNIQMSEVYDGVIRLTPRDVIFVCDPDDVDRVMRG